MTDRAEIERLLINGRTPEEIKAAVLCTERGTIPDCENCPYCGVVDEQGFRSFACYQAEFDLIAYVERLEAKRPKWIKLTEDDRPSDGYYNVMVKKRGVWQRDLLRYDANDDDWWKELSTHDELVPGYLITHWMPLPEPPEEEG